MRGRNLACDTGHYRHRTRTLLVLALGHLPFVSHGLPGISWFSVGLFAAGGGMALYISGAASIIAAFFRRRSAFEDCLMAFAVARVPADVRIRLCQVTE